ncbi:MAG: universal stress protein [Azonexus sp.]|nr:universal stress protein [Azonexus sp.]
MNSGSSIEQDTIVVATDLSAAANMASEQAARLAQRLAARIVLLHISTGTGGNSVEAELLFQQAQRLRDSLRLEVEVEVRHGEAADEIVDYLTACSAHLVVVGEHAKGWLADIFVGSTALRVLHEANSPTLLARRPLTEDRLKILIANDFSDNSLRAARNAYSLFPSSEFTLLHAYPQRKFGIMRLDGEPEQKIADSQNALLATIAEKEEAFRHKLELPADAKVFWNVTGENPVMAILEHIKKTSPDVLVMGKHSGNVVEERLLGSVPQKLLYNAKCNILLVP